MIVANASDVRQSQSGVHDVVRHDGGGADGVLHLPSLHAYGGDVRRDNVDVRGV